MYNILFVLLFVVIVFIISRRVIRTKKYSKYESNGSDIVQRFINKKQKKEPYKPVFDFTEENDESVECIDIKPIKKFTEKIIDFIYEYNVLIYWGLEVPVFLTILFSNLDENFKTFSFAFLIIPHYLCFFINAGLCIYLIFANFYGTWAIISTIIASVVLILDITVLLVTYIVSIKKEHRHKDNRYIAVFLLSIIAVASCSVYKIYDKIEDNNISNYCKSDIELFYLSEHVFPGETASIEVKSEPNTEHEIIVTYSSGTSTAEGLDNKFSDDNGYVEWSWKVGTNTNEGTYPIEIYNLDTFESETFYFTIE